MKKHTETGFTLVELSIVIIIVGLIVAGVLGGQRLIDQARLRTLIGDKTDIETALANFRNEFNALPGDYRNATDYWAAGAACGDATAIDNANECNGNGDRKIDHNIGGDDTAQAADESYTAWVHMGNSGHYPGQYTGIPTNITAGVNVPEAGFGRSVAITLMHSGDAVNLGTANLNDNLILFGTADGTANPADTPFIAARDARSIDEKVDDGLPASGTVLGVNSGGGGEECIDTGEYNVDGAIVSIAADGCALVFKSGS